MPDASAPHSTISKIVNDALRDDKSFSKEDKEQTAALIILSLTQPGVITTVNELQEAHKALQRQEAEYEKKGYDISYRRKDGLITAVVLSKDGQKTELSSGKEFEEFKRILDRQRALRKDLTIGVLNVAADSSEGGYSAKTSRAASNILDSMAQDGKISRDLLQSIEQRSKESGGKPKPSQTAAMAGKEVDVLSALESRPLRTPSVAASADDRALPTGTPSRLG